MERFGAIFAVLLAVAITGFILLASPATHPATCSTWAIMDMTGSALTNPSDNGAEKVAQVLLTADGMALLPLLTAIIVGARLTGRIRGEPRPRGGHVIVVGGGDVGTRVVGGLHDLGFDVVLIDQERHARGVAFARNLGLPVVIGDAATSGRCAGPAWTARSRWSRRPATTSSTWRRRCRPGRCAARTCASCCGCSTTTSPTGCSETLGNVVSRSVSYLAAPAFAVAMLEHKVLRTIAVGRHVLLIADVRVEPGSDIAGRPLADLERDGLSRVLALAERGTPRFNWSPRRDRRLVRGRPDDRARHPGGAVHVPGREPPAGQRAVIAVRH